MRIDVVTIFPDYLAPLRLSLLGKAGEQGLLDLRVHDLRRWTTDRHRTVDDSPYGGGAGMVMKPEIWGRAIDEIAALAPWPGESGGPAGPVTDPARSGTDPTGSGAPSDPDLDADVAPSDADGTPNAAPSDPVPTAGPTPSDADPVAGPTPSDADAGPSGDRRPVLILPGPTGRVFDQACAQELAGRSHLILACGRYEGIDARLAEHYRSRPGEIEVRELSIGDYVLNGGEVAALVVIEAVGRLLPGVLGNPESLAEESHGADGLLEYPLYTKPPTWRGLGVPDVLVSGHHARIARWRRDRALERTARLRPDMIGRLDPAGLDAADRAVLEAAGEVDQENGTEFRSSEARDE